MAPKRRDSSSSNSAAGVASPLLLKGESSGMTQTPTITTSSPSSNNAKRRKIGSTSFAMSSYSPSMAAQAFVKWDAALRQYSDAMNSPLIRKFYEILYCNHLAEEAHKAIKTHLLEAEQLIVTRKKRLVGSWVSQRDSDTPRGKLKINEAFHGVVSFPERGIQSASVSGVIENSNCGVDELRLRVEQDGREGFVQLKLPQNNVKNNVTVLAKLSKEDEDDEDAELEGSFFLEEESQQQQQSNTDNNKAIQFRFSLIRKEFAETIEEEDLFNELVATDSIEGIEEGFETDDKNNRLDEKHNNGHYEGESVNDEEDEDELDGDIDTSTFAFVSAHLLRRSSSTTSHSTNNPSSDSTRNDATKAKKRSTKEID